MFGAYVCVVFSYRITPHIPRSDEQMNSSINIGAGVVGAGLLGLVLFRGGGAKMAMAGFGAGFGAGISWQDANRELKKLFK